MVSVEVVRQRLEERTATAITLSRFVTLLHRWIRKYSGKDINMCQRKREAGYPYLTEQEAQAFINWASTLDKQSFQSQPIPALWQRTKIGRHMYSWH